MTDANQGSQRQARLRTGALVLVSGVFAGGMLAGCQEQSAQETLAAAPSIVLGPVARAVDESRTAMNTFLSVVVPGSSCKARIRRKGVRFEALPDKVAGRGCGYTSAVKITAFGNVGLSKPIILRCQMADRVSDWLTGTVQPTARRVLKTRVTKMLVSSGYRCRNAFGLRGTRRGRRLSQHAHANAFDIWGMEFANGSRTRVIDHWKFDLKADIARAKADVARLQKVNPRANVHAQVAALRARRAQRTLSLRPRLPRTGDLRGFWRYISLRGCAIFNKVFTPESDWVHRNHIHFDLSPTRLCGMSGHWARWVSVPKGATTVRAGKARKPLRRSRKRRR